MSLSNRERNLLQGTLAEVHRLRGLDADVGGWPESVMQEVSKSRFTGAGREKPGPCGPVWRRPIAAAGFALAVLSLALFIFMAREPEKTEMAACLKDSGDVVAAQLFFIE